MSAQGSGFLRTVRKLLRKRPVWALTPLVLAPALVAGASWWLTVPLDEARTPRGGATRGIVAADLLHGISPLALKEARPVWPERRLEGESAKRLMLKVLLEAQSWLGHVDGYSALFRKQERIDGALGAEQCMEMKIRNSPFAVYLKYLNPQPGKEVVYAEGRYDNKLIAHAGGLTRLLLPRLAVSPTHTLAMVDNRHPITEAGLAYLVDKLISFRKMDLADAASVTILDRAQTRSGRTVLRSVHEHPQRNSERPYARVVVLYDPETFVPIEISNYDWPAADPVSEPLMAERYSYEQLRFDVRLSDLDFDPANPAYAFHRY